MGFSKISGPGLAPFLQAFLNYFRRRFQALKNEKNSNPVCFPGEATHDTSQKRGEPRGTQVAPRRHPRGTHLRFPPLVRAKTYLNIIKRWSLVPILVYILGPKLTLGCPKESLRPPLDPFGPIHQKHLKRQLWRTSF